MKQLIISDWWPVLKPQFETANYQQLHNFLVDEYGHQQVYPEMHHIFEAFNWTPFSKVKVVILGQDPYHGPGQAHGCSFSVLPGVAVPPSLQNIYKELQADLGCPPVKHGYLRFWAEQGVLLLNSVVESAHPSPLSAYRGFFGSRPFSKTNQFLEMTGQAPINWQLPSTVDHL